MDFIYVIFEYVLNCVVMVFRQLFVLFGAGVVLGLLQHQVAKLLEIRSARVFGMNKFYKYICPIGVVVHELGHLLMCKIFRHKIVEMKLFQPDPETGTLGYVAHTFNSKSHYQRIGNFFIGIAPVVVSPVVIYLLYRYLMGGSISGLAEAMPGAASGVGAMEYAGAIFNGIGTSVIGIFQILFTAENFQSWRLYVFLYLTFSIGSSITLSSADIRIASGGFLLLLTSLFALNMFTMWLLDDFLIGMLYSVSEFFIVLIPIMALVVSLNLLFIILLFLVPTPSR